MKILFRLAYPSVFLSAALLSSCKPPAPTTATPESVSAPSPLPTVAPKVDAASTAATAPEAALAPAATQNARPPGGTDNPAMMERRFERMKTDLALTDDQATKIKAVMDEQYVATGAVREDATLSDKDRSAKMRSIRDAAGEKIKAILTPEQQAKADQIRAERKAQMEQKKAEKAAASQSASPAPVQE